MPRVRLEDHLNGNNGKGVRVRTKDNPRHDKVTVVDLELHECRYPVSTTRDGLARYLFCARKTREGRVYCDVHHGIAHVRRPPEKPFTGFKPPSGSNG